MDITTAAEILRKHNEWLRSDEPNYLMIEPKTIREATDTVVEYLTGGLASWVEFEEQDEDFAKITNAMKVGREKGVAVINIKKPVGLRTLEFLDKKKIRVMRPTVMDTKKDGVYYKIFL